MKRHLLCQILLAFSLVFVLSGCTSLNYVDEDWATVKSQNVQTSENFNINTVEKTTENVDVKVGISETVLSDTALVLYFNIKNSSDITFKFDINDIKVTSPIGEVSFISPANFIEAYQNFEAANYANSANTAMALGSTFAQIQNYNRQQDTSTKNTLEIANLSPELMEVEKNIRGIQKHTLTSYKYIRPNQQDYFYIFLHKPEEFPIVVTYKNLTYKFGGKRNVKN